MEDFSYLAKPTTRQDFAMRITDAFAVLRQMRDFYRDAAIAADEAKAALDEAEREAIANKLNEGSNAEMRAAKLAQIVKPLADIHRDAKKEASLLAVDLQHSLDYVRMLQMIIDANKVGIATVQVEESPAFA